MKKTTIINRLLLPFCLAACLLACSKDEEPQSYMPSLATNSADGLTRFDAVLSGTVTEKAGSQLASVDVFFLYAKGTSLVDAEELAATADPSTEGRYTANLSGLTPGQTYCYSICARSGGSVAKGELIQFSTLASSEPVLAESTATEVTETTAVLTSQMTDNGGRDISQRGFAYKVYEEGMPEPTTSDRTRTVPLDAESFTGTLTGLQAGTTYIVRAYAINSTGTGYGPAETFTTEALKLPKLTCATTDVTAFAVSLTADITSNGGFPVSEYGFCWSTESLVPTIDHLKEVVGTADDQHFEAKIDNLEPETEYYLRAYAINEKGVGYSDAITFKTAQRQVVTLTAPVTSKLDITSVTLTSTVQIPAGVTVTEKGICYSLFSSRPAIDSPHQKDDSQGSNISVSLTGLNEGAAYFATAYAVTRDGTFYSEPTRFTLNRTYEPTVSFTAVSNIGETEATVAGHIDSDGGRDVTERGFCWSSTSSTPNLENGDASMKVEGTGADFSLKLTGLVKGQKYYVRAYAKNVNGVGYSSASNFTTALTKEPEVVNLLMPQIGDDQVTAQATISDNGGLTVTERGFVYSLTATTPRIGAAGVIQVKSTSTDNTFQATISGLTYTTRYYICAYAINAKGTAYTSPITFVTSSSTVPGTFVSVDEAGVADRSATFSGKITSDGNAEVTEVGFCWSETTSEPTLENSSHQKATLNAADNSFTFKATGLKAYTYYYVRAYAKNKNGVGYSYYASFRTKQTTPEGGDNPLPGTE